MRILVLGAAGQVGFELARSMAGLGRVLTADRIVDADAGVALAIDIGDLSTLRQRVDELAPNVIVNAAAYTAVDQAEDEPEAANRVNHEALHVLAQLAAASGALLVHYSTDYVFAGDGDAPYREDQPPAPRSVYGRTKLAGEQALAQSGCAYLLLRTAWVYAARGRNFLLTMLRAAAHRDELSVVDDQIGSPTTARFLADTTARWCGAGCTRPRPSGRSCRVPVMWSPMARSAGVDLPARSSGGHTRWVCCRAPRRCARSAAPSIRPGLSVRHTRY